MQKNLSIHLCTLRLSQRIVQKSFQLIFFIVLIVMYSLGVEPFFKNDLQQFIVDPLILLSSSSLCWYWCSWRCRYQCFPFQVDFVNHVAFICISTYIILWKVGNNLFFKLSSSVQMIFQSVTLITFNPCVLSCFIRSSSSIFFRRSILTYHTGNKCNWRCDKINHIGKNIDEHL